MGGDKSPCPISGASIPAAWQPLSGREPSHSAITLLVRPQRAGDDASRRKARQGNSPPEKKNITKPLVSNPCRKQGPVLKSFGAFLRDSKPAQRMLPSITQHLWWDQHHRGPKAAPAGDRAGGFADAHRFIIVIAGNFSSIVAARFCSSPGFFQSIASKLTVR